MFNLIKYELKAYYKDLIIMVAAICIVSMLLYTRFGVWQHDAIVGVSFLISFAAMIAVLISNITLFSRDMYSNSGYLLFTLPKTGYSILASKVLTALIQGLIVGSVAIIFNYITISLSPAWSLNLLQALTLIKAKTIVLSIVSSIFQYAYFLVLVYFSISLSKIAIRKKKLGKLSGFVIFIIISLILGKLTTMLMTVFPQEFNISLFTNSNQWIAFPINIAALIFSIVTFIMLFLGTSYIIENKIDL